MVAFDYTRPQSTAQRLIKRYGALQAIQRDAPAGGAAYNPGTPTSTKYPAYIAAFDFTTSERRDSAILAGDEKLLVSVEGLSIDPTPGDLVWMGGTWAGASHSGGISYRIIKATPLKPANTLVMWTLQVRK